MNKSIGKEATLLTLSRILSLLISLINVMILSRFRTIEEYGTFSQMNIVISLFSTFLLAGLPSSINYFFVKSKSDEEKSNFLSNYYTINTILSFLTGFFLVLFTPLIVDYFKNDLINTFVFFFFTMPWISIIGGSISNLLIVYNKTKLLSIFSVCSSLIMLLILFISISLNFSFIQYIYLYIFTQIVITLSIYIIAFKLVGNLRIALNVSLLRKILIYSLPLGLATIVGTISIEVDKLMISYFYNTEVMAIYTNAAREMPITIISSSITMILLPQITRLVNENRFKEAVRIWRESISLSYIFMCFFVCTLIVFAPQIISFLYSEKYISGVTIFRIYSVVLLIRTTYFGMILNALGRTKLILYISIFNLVLNAFLNYVFYLLLGINGPAIATLVSMFVSSAIYMLLNAYSTSIKISEIIPVKEIMHISFKNLILAIFFYSITRFLNLGVDTFSIVVGIILGIIWMIAYFLLSIKLIKEKWISLRI